jgi:ankyrin repeat protein
MEDFFNMGIDINIKDYRGWTVLHEATSFSHTGVAIDLIEQMCGRAELHLAIRKRNMHIIQELLARGADINALCLANGQPKNGNPLHFTVQEASAEMLDCLLGGGQRANLDLKDDCNKMLSQEAMLIPNKAVRGRIQALLLRELSRPSM